MRCPRTDTGSPSPLWGKEEQTQFVHVLLMTRTGVSHNSRIPISKENLVSCVQVGGNGNMSSTLSVWEP